ncbi:hypothetical protein E2C01_090677 [Portunus trituberculatus]|uniref:Uncharacterized protein n=1 Tax=Portunus trituberculatus TaxID=210409 RepID=A0A5B7JT21_PORTR|nr:hypothetical protein [Portunus trituberculatus]
MKGELEGERKRGEQEGREREGSKKGDAKGSERGRERPGRHHAKGRLHHYHHRHHLLLLLKQSAHTDKAIIKVAGPLQMSGAIRHFHDVAKHLIPPFKSPDS